MRSIEKNQILTGLKVIGLLLIIEAGFMFISLIAALWYGQGDALSIFLSALITLSAGTLLRFAIRPQKIDIDRRLGILIVASIWLIMTFFGTLPYLIGGYAKDFSTAALETMSGFTTTGASNLDDLEALPKGILLWRSLTHWIGGVGIVVIVISFIPSIGGGAMALFSAESAGPSKTKISPHIGTTGKIICGVYFVLTAICCTVYTLCGMDFFDALNHAFSTLASGGYSTKNSSAAAFSPLLQYMMILFMIPAGTNFILIYYCFKGQFSHLRKSEEFKVYVLTILISALVIFAWILPQSPSVEYAFRSALFHTVSFISSTGFVLDDYSLWPLPAVLILVFLMFCGSMSGSTSGGLKLVRMILLFKNARRIIKRGVHSSAYLPLKLDGKIVQDNVMNNVMVIFLMFVISLIVTMFALVLSGFGMEEAFSSAITCMSNIGPSLGEYGGFGSFADAPVISKWILFVAMYLGRLEIATVLVLFSPSFWRK